MQTDWKKIWQKRTDNFDKIDVNNQQEMFLELKRIDGFDINSGKGLTYDSLMNQHHEIMENLSKYHDVSSVFDLGCGSGANLYILQKEGYVIGGIDYSSSMIDIAKKVLKKDGLIELKCDEAINIDTDVAYDSLIANSVFSYFPDHSYATDVLNKVSLKVRNSFALIDLHNLELKEDFLTYRRQLNPNYDEDYKNLPKLFYDYQFFENWAKMNNFSVVFKESTVEGYWNNRYVFNAYFYRNPN